MRSILVKSYHISVEKFHTVIDLFNNFLISILNLETLLCMNKQFNSVDFCNPCT